MSQSRHATKVELLSPGGSAAEPNARVLFLDNLRIGLIVLVVLHHVAMAYGAAGFEFYYVELHPSGFSRALLIFVLSNQAWFMGAFFLVAGYFTPGSLDRKGSGAFLRARLLRLGVPLVVYAVILNPVAMFGGFFLPDYLEPLTWETYQYFDYVRMGPMWFVAMLLIFSFGYAAWRSVGPDRSGSNDDNSMSLRYSVVGVFVVALTAVTYLTRMQVAVGESAFGFPSLGYLPQYLSFFVVGVIAYRRNWLLTLPSSMGWAGFAAAIAAAVFLFPLAFSGRMFSLELSDALGKAFGDGYWQSAVYSFWDTALAVGLCLALIVLLRAVANRQRGRFGGFLTSHSYAVYILHIPIVVFVAIALKGLEIEHLLKVAVAAGIAVPLCFVVAYLVRRVPGVAKIV